MKVIAPITWSRISIGICFFQFHESRKSIIEHILAIGNGGQSDSYGGHRIAISKQDGGKKWRRRQRRESAVAGGALGVDSSVDTGTVRFLVAVIESNLSSGFDKGVRFAGIDNNKLMSDSFGKGLNDKMSC